MSRKIPWVTRAAAVHGLIAGRPAIEVAPALGVSMSALKSWAKLAGMELMMGSVGGARPMPMDAVIDETDERGYRRLTLADRSLIQAGLAMNPPLSVRRIARVSAAFENWSVSAVKSEHSTIGE